MGQKRGGHKTNPLSNKRLSVSKSLTPGHCKWKLFRHCCVYCMLITFPKLWQQLFEVKWHFPPGSARQTWYYLSTKSINSVIRRWRTARYYFSLGDTQMPSPNRKFKMTPPRMMLSAFCHLSRIRWTIFHTTSGTGSARKDFFSGLQLRQFHFYLPNDYCV